MPGNMRAQPLVVTSYGGNTMQTDEEIQFAPSSRPVSFYDNFKDVQTMPPCVTSAMSVGNLNEARDKSAGVTISVPNNNNNNRVSSAVSTGNVSKIQSSKVMGAVSTGNIGKIGRADKDRELGRAPSMANCLSTTVPVNLAASQIAGRHTPTRNSLRHSRMIVLHRSGHRKSHDLRGSHSHLGPQKFLPPLVYRKRLGRCLAALQTILGIAVTSLSLWLLLWAPHLPVVDNPYWSGMPLLLSGSFGICLLCCFKKEYPGMGPGFCLSSTKVISASLALLSTVASTAACVFSVMHLVRLMGLECTPARVLNAACVCRPRVEVANNSTATVVRYIDLNCPEVESILAILLIFSATCNALGAVVSGWYTYLHWSTRNKRPKYIQVRTSPHGNHYPTTRPIYNPHMSER